MLVLYTRVVCSCRVLVLRFSIALFIFRGVVHCCVFLACVVYFLACCGLVLQFGVVP